MNEKKKEKEKTNLRNKSLISVDRTNKDTLPRTILCALFKSSAKDWSPPISYISIQQLLKENL